MKKTAMIIASFAVAAVAFRPTGGVEGKMFPNMQCEDYNGKKINIPAETNGKYTLLGMAFSNDAEANLRTWINPVYNRFIAQHESSGDVFDVRAEHDVHLFFIPMFTGLNKLTSNSSKDKIRKATDKELYPYLLFYEGDKTYKEELDFQKKDVPYFFVLDKTGKIVYATFGSYDEKKMDKIIDIIEEN